MLGKIAKKIVIKEDTGGACGVSYYTTLIIKKNSISYKEETEYHIDSMFYAERDHTFKYKILSSLFESTFEELVDEIEYIKSKRDNNEIPYLIMTDVGMNEIIVHYDDNSKLSFVFYGNLYENKFDSIANILRSMIPSCEQISEYLMTEDELENLNNPPLEDYSEIEEKVKKAVEKAKALANRNK